MCYAGCDFLLTMTARAPQSDRTPRTRILLLLFALLAFNFLLRIVYARFEFLLNPDELPAVGGERERVPGRKDALS